MLGCGKKAVVRTRASVRKPTTRKAFESGETKKKPRVSSNSKGGGEKKESVIWGVEGKEGAEGTDSKGEARIACKD